MCASCAGLRVFCRDGLTNAADVPCRSFGVYKVRSDDTWVLSQYGPARCWGRARWRCLRPNPLLPNSPSGTLVSNLVGVTVGAGGSDGAPHGSHRVAASHHRFSPPAVTTFRRFRRTVDLLTRRNSWRRPDGGALAGSIACRSWYRDRACMPLKTSPPDHAPPEMLPARQVLVSAARPRIRTRGDHGSSFEASMNGSSPRKFAAATWMPHIEARFATGGRGDRRFSAEIADHVIWPQ